LEGSKVLQNIDLSWAKLTPKNLEQISFALLNKIKSIRMINFSYNKLNFDDDHFEYYHSVNFLENIKQFLGTSVVLNHVKLSGMNFGKM